MNSPHDPTRPDPFERIADALDALVILKRHELGLPLANDAPEPTDILGLDATDHPDGIGISLIDDRLSAQYEYERAIQATKEPATYPSRTSGAGAR